MKKLQQQYAAILEAHLKEPNEAHLFQGHSFGKQCADMGTSMSELIGIHFAILEENNAWLSKGNFADSQALLLEVTLAMSVSGGMKTMESVLGALYDESVRQFKELSRVKQELKGYSLNLEEKVKDKLYELELAEEGFEILVETIPDIVYKIDPDGNFVYLNKAITALGYEPEDLVGMHFSEIIFPDEFQLVSSSAILPEYAGKTTGNKDAPKLFDERRTGERKTADLEVKLLLKSSKVVPGTLEPVGRGVIVVELNSSGIHATDPISKKRVFIGTVGVIRDVSVRKKAEAELRNYRVHLEKLVEERTIELFTANQSLQTEIAEHMRAEEFANNILKSMGEGLVVLDGDLNIISVNRAYLEQVKKPREEIIGCQCYEVSHNNKQPCYLVGEECPVHKTFATGKPHSAVHRHTDSEGNTSLVEIKSYPMGIKSGKPVTVIEVITDISEKEKLKDELLQAVKMEAIGTLAGGIAHDFNNILTAILGFTDLAINSIPSTSPTSAYLAQVRKAGDRAKNLVQQILTFSRKGHQQVAPLIPAALVKEVIKLMRSSLPSTIELIDEVDSECGAILADPTQLHQVVVNIITNAFHAMEDEKGVLRVQLTRKNLSAAEVKGERIKPGSFVLLSISDTGSGMDLATKKRIFEPYFTTKEVGKGTGMGLAVVQGIIQSYGGTIKVESEVGKGSTFYIYFPSVAGNTAESIVEKKEILPTGNERILIVDDEEAIVEMQKAVLEQLGYQITTKTESEDAFNEFKANPTGFDMIITDQTMPNMTGSELSERVLKIRPEMAIVLCTGYSAMISEVKATSIGIKRFMMKPINQKELAKIVREVFDEKKL